MDCEQVCLTCKNQQTIKVNPAGYHGLCNLHIIALGQYPRCIHCESIVPILFDTSIKHCCNCSNISKETYKNCGHDVCESCISKECSVCRTLCHFCRASKDANLMQCMHLICKDCVKDANYSCPLCKVFVEVYETECDYCLIKAKIIEIFECPHKICENCYGENGSQCPFCKKLIKKDEKNQGVGVFVENRDENFNPQEAKLIDKYLPSAKIPDYAFEDKEIYYSDPKNDEKSDNENFEKKHIKLSSPSSSSSKNSKGEEIFPCRDFESQPLLSKNEYKKFETAEVLLNSERSNFEDKPEIKYSTFQKDSQKNKGKPQLKIQEYADTSSENEIKIDADDTKAVLNTVSIDVGDIELDEKKEEVSSIFKVLLKIYFCMTCCCCFSLFWCCGGTFLDESEVNENSCFYNLLCLCCCKFSSLKQKYWVDILKKCTLCKRKVEKKLN